MNGHKIKSESRSHVEVQAPDGTTFKVAKAGLSMQMLATMAKMPRVEHHSDDSGDPSDAVVDPAAGITPQPSYSPGDAPPPVNGPDITANAAPGNDEEAAAPDPSTQAAPVGQQTYPTPDGSAPAGQDPAQGQAPAPQPDSPDYLATYQQGMTAAGKQAMAGEDAKAAAIGATSDETAKINDAKAVAMQKFQNDSQAELKTNLDENTRIATDIANTKIDPNHFFDTQSTGSKLGMLAGLLISGAGANAGQGNMAMNLINKSIDADIDAQKANLGTKQSLLKNNLDKTQNMFQAQQLTRANQLAVFQGQLDAAAARNGSAAAKAQAQIEKAKIQEQIVGINKEVAEQRWQMGQLNGTPTDASGLNEQRYSAYLRMLPKDDRADLAKEYTAYNKSKQDQDFINGTVDQIKALQTSSAYAANPKQTMRQIAQKSDMLASHMARDQDGRVNPETKATYDTQLAGFFDSPATVESGRKNLLDAAKLKNGPTPNLQRLGIVSRQDPVINTSGSDAARINAVKQPKR